jgi:integral membrane protein
MFAAEKISMQTSSIFRKVAIAEGISYILLLFIAMPLKYMFDMPLAVKYTGWAHGMLFVLYVVFFVMTWQESRWKASRAGMYLFSSLLPFAPFWVDKQLKKER